MESSYWFIELRVNNHPGVLSHITGLFSRRGFNLDGILCAPLAESSQSKILLLTRDDGRLEQIVKQVEKLHDVLSVRVKNQTPLEAPGQCGPDIFKQICQLMDRVCGPMGEE